MTPQEEAAKAAADRKFALLRFAVIAMGVLLVAGMFSVIGIIAYRASKAGTKKLPGFAPLEVPVAAGTQVDRLALDGNRMAVHVRSPKGSEILIIDVRRGYVSGRIRLNEQK